MFITKNLINAFKKCNFKNAKHSSLDQIEYGNGTIENDPKNISEAVNNHFVTLVDQLFKNKVNVIDPDSRTDNELENKIKKSLFLKPINTKFVSDFIKGMDHKKSNRSDSPQTKFLKIAVDIIAPILTYIFNSCIEEGVFPETLKIAEVIPIFKSGNRSIINNYRPISLLSPFAKILENYIYNELLDFLNKHRILYNLQYGFRQDSSTELAVSQIVEDLAESMDNNKINCSVFLDLAKAFNTVNHEILLTKLNKCGVRGITLKLFESFLGNRKQFTTINNHSSSLESIDTGVPQGSTLGPLLFLIYINDLPTATTMKVRLFADDACLSMEHNDPSTLQLLVNRELSKVHCWLDTNKLFINYSKSNFLIFTNKKHNHIFDLKIGLETIHQKCSTKYLGIILDDKLTWEPHIENLKTKLARTCYIFYKLKNYVNENTLKMVYYSLVYPHLQYGITSWGKAAGYLIKKIITMQKSIVKIICRKGKREPSTPLFFRLGMLKLEDVYKLQLSKLVHKYKNESLIGEGRLVRLRDVHSYNTRLAANSNYFIPRRNKDVGRNCFSCSGPTIWQNVPSNLKALSFESFKLRLKNHLLEMYNPDQPSVSA